MISLSRIIKSRFANTARDGNKKIKIRSFDYLFHEADSETVPVFHQKDTEQVLEQANLEAEALIREAKLAAEQILQQAKAERKHFEEVEKPQMMQEIREGGFNEGLELGRQRGYTELAESLEYAKEIVSASKKDYHAHIEESERTILELGIKVAERIIGTNLQGSEEKYLSFVKQAIKEARDYREVWLHVHPNHYGYILSQKEELISIFPKEAGFYIYPDQELKETSCIIESAHGRIDAGVDSQLEEIKQKLIELLEGE